MELMIHNWANQDNTYEHARYQRAWNRRLVAFYALLAACVVFGYAVPVMGAGRAVLFVAVLAAFVALLAACVYLVLAFAVRLVFRTVDWLTGY